MEDFRHVMTGTRPSIQPSNAFYILGFRVRYYILAASDTGVFKGITLGIYFRRVNGGVSIRKNGTYFFHVNLFFPCWNLGI